MCGHVFCVNLKLLNSAKKMHITTTQKMRERQIEKEGERDFQVFPAAHSVAKAIVPFTCFA